MRMGVSEGRDKWGWGELRVGISEDGGELG